MKKLIGVIFAVALVLSLSTATFAANYDHVDAKKGKVVVSIVKGDGMYNLASKSPKYIAKWKDTYGRELVMKVATDGKNVIFARTNGDELFIYKCNLKGKSVKLIANGEGNLASLKIKGKKVEFKDGTGKHTVKYK